MQETAGPGNLVDPNLTFPDLLIAGAGPAGLATAIAAASRGLTVQVVDSNQPIIDKACGEGLLPAAVHALAQLGVDPTSVPHAPFRGIRFLDANNTRTSASGLFREAPGIGIRRTRLHQLLLDRALALGVRIDWQTTVKSLSQQADALTVRTNRNTLRPRYLIGADGLHSKIRALAGLDRASSSRARIGIRHHFAVAPDTDLVEVYWNRVGQAYVTPVSDYELCVAFVYRTKPSTRDHLAAFPALQARLRSAPPVGAPRGAITLTCSLQRVTSGNIALVGDASGSVDAITGDGLALCFQQALALADAIATNNLAAYQQAHRRLSKLPLLISRALLLMERHPTLCSLALRSFKHHPAIFPKLLDIHIGHNPLCP